MQSCAYQFPEKLRYLHALVSVCVLLTCTMSTFASRTGPGLQADPLLAQVNFAAVLSPVVPLVIMKADEKCLGPPKMDNLTAAIPCNVHVYIADDSSKPYSDLCLVAWCLSRKGALAP